ncbi:MAG: sensor histidine kinase, partial [Candidatus Limnocylindria bacterium]
AFFEALARRAAGDADRLLASSRARENQAAAAHAESERAQLAALVDELDDAVLILGPDERVLLANRAAGAILAAPVSPGRHVAEVVREHEILDAVRAARSERAAERMVERGQPRRVVRVLARSLTEGRVLLVLQDLSTLRRLETLRADFVANVSHELRTPIASLKAMAETLEQGAIDDPAAARDFVGRMHREIDGLAQLVAELLSLTRVESGQEAVEPRPGASEELLASAVARLRPLADRAGVSLELAPLPPLPPVLADPERVAQVLSNLIHNAVKYTPPGGRIELGAHAEDDAVAVSVSDTGVGIDTEDLERIFERFYKADRSRAGGGTGLGLAIAKHIVQAHGGRIWAESDGLGRGARLVFTLPVADASAPEPLAR